MLLAYLAVSCVLFLVARYSSPPLPFPIPSHPFPSLPFPSLWCVCMVCVCGCMCMYYGLCVYMGGVYVCIVCVCMGGVYVW